MSPATAHRPDSARPARPRAASPLFFRARPRRASWRRHRQPARECAPGPARQVIELVVNLHRHVFALARALPAAWFLCHACLTVPERPVASAAAPRAAAPGRARRAARSIRFAVAPRRGDCACTCSSACAARSSASALRLPLPLHQFHGARTRSSSAEKSSALTANAPGSSASCSAAAVHRSRRLHLSLHFREQSLTSHRPPSQACFVRV